ncbi:MAG TPA: hypothetical protein VNZ57_12635 [Longimicrobiales bacterium]|nr:hypothetical protein [Longimicrobiales bacterium]
MGRTSTGWQARVLRGWCAALLTMVVSAACAAQGVPGRSMTSTRYMLTADELTRASHANVYDAIDNLRPNWLRPCCVDSFTNPSRVQAYVDDVRISGVEELRTIAVQDVQYVRWFNGVEASSRWGLDHGAGAVYVALR